MSDEIVSKMAVSVTEMARMVGLSRARFYQLVRAGTFPPPDREPATDSSQRRAWFPPMERSSICTPDLGCL